VPSGMRWWSAGGCKLAQGNYFGEAMPVIG
jgi:EAL domain-containing protein (putative c-di-GMP-specific phosphodiesterase class I)